MRELLIVDDDAVTLEMMRLILELDGYAVDIAHGYVEALAFMQSKGAKYSLLICDVTMPEKSGLELISEVRSMGFLLPALIISGAEIPPTEGTAFLRKPVSIDTLRKIVAGLVEPAHIPHD